MDPIKQYQAALAKAKKIADLAAKIRAEEIEVDQQIKDARKAVRNLVQTSGYGTTATMTFNGRTLKARKSGNWVIVSENGVKIDRYFRNYFEVELALATGEI